MLISSDGIIIRIPMEAIRLCSRPSKGVRVMKVTEGERLIAAVAVARDEEETYDEVPAEEAASDTDDIAEDITEDAE